MFSIVFEHSFPYDKFFSGIIYFYAGKKHPVMVFNNYEFMAHKTGFQASKHGNSTSWRCKREPARCKARLVTSGGTMKIMNSLHSHPPTFTGEIGKLKPIRVKIVQKVN
ncbi:hypothetical protein WA026_007546 [Henosepilachna vigintioctopunctata]|uniref:FLYWCH-type domain-containing protein n=1 Tax=Henosepilachna vigintioctopunctata TaxID=420089 RepID=A0AAW1UUE9_9CUCU